MQLSFFVRAETSSRREKKNERKLDRGGAERKKTIIDIRTVHQQCSKSTMTKGEVLNVLRSRSRFQYSMLINPRPNSGKRVQNQLLYVRRLHLFASFLIRNLGNELSGPSYQIDNDSGIGRDKNAWEAFCAHPMGSDKSQYFLYVEVVHYFELCSVQKSRSTHSV